MDEERTDNLIREHNGLYVDFSRQNMTEVTLQVLAGLTFRVLMFDGGCAAGCTSISYART